MQIHAHACIHTRILFQNSFNVIFPPKHFPVALQSVGKKKEMGQRVIRLNPSGNF